MHQNVILHEIRELYFKEKKRMARNTLTQHFIFLL